MVRRCQTFELFESLDHAAFPYEAGTFRPYDGSHVAINYFFILKEQIVLNAII